MNHLETLAYLTHRIKADLDFVIDEIGGNCDCENGNVEDALEMLYVLKTAVVNMSNAAVDEQGGSLNFYPDGSPVLVRYKNAKTGKAAEYLRRKTDPEELPSDLREWADTPYREPLHLVESEAR